MRGWLAALALVPAVAWGQVDCRGVEARESFSDYAAMIANAKSNGVGERQLMQNMRHAPAPIRAARHEAIRMMFSPTEFGFSTIVTSMQAACYMEQRRQ